MTGQYTPRESHLRFNYPDGGPVTFTAIAADGTELGTYDNLVVAANILQAADLLHTNPWDGLGQHLRETRK